MHEPRFAALGFRLHLTEDEGVWVATARRLDTGDTFGPPVPADSADEAAELLALWLEWQQRHTSALSELQSAEAAYNRLSAQLAFGTTDEGLRVQVREALAVLDDRRRALDLVREQKPWPH